MSIRRQVNILLVEDHEDSLRALAKLLTMNGYHVLPAGTTAAARELAASYDCELVMCDLGLPDGTGTDLLRELRAAHEWRAIAITGSATPEARGEAKAAGFDLYLKKPLDFEMVLRAVAKLTETRSPPHSPLPLDA